MSKIYNEIIFCLEEIVKFLHDKPSLAIRELHEIASLIDSNIPYGHGHSKRVSEYSLKIGRRIGLDDKELVYLETAALLHDFGKIGIDEKILNKKGKLTPSERKLMEEHVYRGYYILSIFRDFEKPLEGILSHHEHYDGSGYPKGLKNGEIPLNGRIIAIVDAFDAIISERPYRKTRTRKEAIKELIRHSGTQFDPDVIKVFIEILEEG
jgi:HD-GYP domain-containing protein (c-di-GMP phosphodiesterase class II)